MKKSVAAVVVYALVALAINVAVIATVVHFIRKFW